ncbi:MAG: hypothetical protein NXI22_17575 [bacterium]|nr:hypothetical protein [bacterium]
MKHTNIDSSQEKKFEAYVGGCWLFLGMCALAGAAIGGWSAFAYRYSDTYSGKLFFGSILLPIVSALGMGIGLRMLLAPRGFFQSERGGRLIANVGLRGGIETRLTGLLFLVIGAGLIVFQLAMSLHYLGIIRMP